MKIIKKISVKSVMGDLKKMVKEDQIKDGEAIMRVAGICKKFESGESDYGPWVRFIGSFRAYNLLTGELCASPKLFLPDTASDLLQVEVSRENSSDIEFGFDIVCHLDPDTPVGYTFSIITLNEPTQDDPLVRLLEKIGTPALPASAS